MKMAVLFSSLGPIGPSSLGPSFSQILLSLSLEENIVAPLRDTENFVREGKFKFEQKLFCRFWYRSSEIH